MAEGRLDWNRIVSGAIAVAWLGLTAFAGGVVPFIYAALSLVLPPACIWFPDVLGGLTTTFPGLSSMSITHGSPGCAVRLFGWVALLALTVVRVIVFVAMTP